MVNSCIMIVAVIYGPTPSITIEKLDKAPPEKIFKNPNSWLDPKKPANLDASIPGIGIAENSLNTTNNPKTTRTFFRNSGISKI